MREISIPTLPNAGAAMARLNQPDQLPEPPDPNFLRHQQALASQRTMTPAHILRPTLIAGAATVSHW